MFPSLALYLKEESFVAHTNDNFMALLSAQRPYGMTRGGGMRDTRCRAMLCCVTSSPDGSLLVTGHRPLLRPAEHTDTEHAAPTPAGLRVSLHPVLPAVVTTCDWGDEIRIWQ
nr:unnamed protein product [Salmo salar]|eukprot:XP_014068567.1 PREDICTED: WD repeat-containing protein 25-like [Salmo salar]